VARPIGNRNAIETMAFMIAFERPISAGTGENLLGLEALLKDELPNFSRINSLMVRVEEGKPTPLSTYGGVLLQRFGPDGRPVWTLRADGNAVIVSCHDYESWLTESTHAIDYLRKAILATVDDDNPATMLALQTIDKFIAEKHAVYKITDVFNKKTRYLTKQAAESGHLWHVFQGWFEQNDEDGGDGRYLNVLNLSTNEAPNGHITSIDHTVQFQLRNPKVPKEVADEASINGVFYNLHTRNKMIISELLNARQCRAIGL
jgi:uncharacterized protein (TIGR04255 family)